MSGSPRILSHTLDLQAAQDSVGSSNSGGDMRSTIAKVSFFVATMVVASHSGADECDPILHANLYNRGVDISQGASRDYLRHAMCSTTDQTFSQYLNKQDS